MDFTEGPTGYEFSGYRLLPGQRQLMAPDGSPVTLRGRVFELLCFLVEHRGRVVSKAELLEALWPDTVVEENNLNQAVSALRQALGDRAQSPQMVMTVTGRGYQFIDDVTELDDRPAAAEPAAAPRDRRYTRLIMVALAGAVLVLAVLYLSTDRETVPRVIDDIAGAKARLVTDFPGAHTQPVFSPDGSMLAWVGTADDTSRIWVQNLESGETIAITDGEDPAYSPTWSPSNDRIVYVRVRRGAADILAVGPMGTEAPRLLVESATDPAFAKFVDRFVFSRGNEIWIADGDGRSPRRIDGLPAGAGFAPREPALSPDGSMVAFIHAEEGPIGNLYVIPTDGGEARAITSFSVADARIAASPEWSADGKTIVFSVLMPIAGGQLWTADVGTGATSALTSGPSGLSEPALSSDGTRLAYVNVRAIWRLTRIMPDTGARETIHDSRRSILLPFASPDGSTIVFFSVTGSGAHVFTIGTDGKNLRQWTFDEPGQNTLPFWSADGQSIFYYRGRSLHRIYIDEGRDEQVIQDFHWSSRNWPAAHGDRLVFREFDQVRGIFRAIIRDLVTGAEVELPISLQAARWSEDGRTLLGHVTGTRELAICDAENLACEALTNDQGPIDGFRPAWSNDEQRIFFLRRPDDRGCCTLWSVRRDGSDERRHAHLDDYDLANSYFDVDQQNAVFYNHVDRGDDEIWVATTRP